MILLVLYLVALIRPISPFIEYLINREYIANVLCVNKNNPEIKCNGKCYLNKQLKKANEAEQSGNQAVPPKIEMEKYPVSSIDDYNFFNKVTDPSKGILFPYHSCSIKEHFSDVPTPPPKPFC